MSKKKIVTAKAVRKILQKKKIPFKGDEKKICAAQAGIDKGWLMLFIDFLPKGRFKCDVLGATMFRTTDPMKAIRKFVRYWDKEKSKSLKLA